VPVRTLSRSWLRWPRSRCRYQETVKDPAAASPGCCPKVRSTPGWSGS